MVDWLTSNSPIPYPDAVAEMEAHVDAMHAGKAGERIWLLEHPPLYTAGTSAKPGDLVDPRRFIAPDHVQGLATEIAETDVVDQDVDNVRWLAAVFLLEFGEPGVQCLVFLGPLLSILLLQYVVFGIVNDGLGGLDPKAHQAGAQHHVADLCDG